MEKSRPLSRDRWLEMALQTLSESGHNKFSLDALIKGMPVSKGSFYWHFENRADFLMALVEHWDRHETQIVIDALSALPKDVTAEKKLWNLMCIVNEVASARHDLLIRSLALEFPKVESAVMAVIQKRTETVKGLFAEMGFSGDDLEIRTAAFVAMMSLDQHIGSGMPAEDYKKQLKLRHKFFVERR